MKKIALLLLLSSVASAVQAQEAAKSRIRQWQVGVTASPDLSYRNLSAAAGSPAAVGLLVGQRNDAEQAAPAFTAGLSARHFRSEHWGLEFGLQYASRNYRSGSDQAVFEGSIDPATGLPLKAPTDFETRTRRRFLDVPLGLVYRSSNTKALRFTASTGLAMNVRLSAERETRIRWEGGPEERQTGSEADLRTVNVSGYLSAGIDWQLSKKMNLTISPIGRYGLLPVVDAPIRERLFSVGLQVGAFYALR